MLNRATQAVIRKFKDADGNYLWSPPKRADLAPTLMSYPIAESEDIPNIASNSYSVAFGDFQRGYLVVDRAGIRVLRDPYSANPYVLFYRPSASAAGYRTSTRSSCSSSAPHGRRISKSVARPAGAARPSHARHSLYPNALVAMLRGRAEPIAGSDSSC